MTYLGLLFAVALAGIGLAGAGILWRVESQREKEKELLFIGEEFRRAIGRYYDAAPEGAKVYPATLEDLLQDRRYPYPVRYLRKIYRDPFSGTTEWTLIKEQERIVGVASKSLAKPFKVAGFAANQDSFEQAATLADWQFVHAGATKAGPATGSATNTSSTTSQARVP